jgi:hypothetical protein
VEQGRTLGHSGFCLLVFYFPFPASIYNGVESRRYTIYACRLSGASNVATAMSDETRLFIWFCYQRIGFL